jgi:hypothetical protein
MFLNRTSTELIMVKFNHLVNLTNHEYFQEIVDCNHGTTGYFKNLFRKF